MLNKNIIINIFFIFFIGELHIYANETHDKNSNEISDYNKNRIKNGYLKPLNVLEETDKEKYIIIIKNLPNNEKVEHYYYSIEIRIIIGENKTQYFSLDKYNTIKDLPEYKDLKIEKIEYGIWYYEILFNKYENYRGDPTGKCFSIIFNDKNEFVGKYFWR
jgi:hypothetical protein